VTATLAGGGRRLSRRGRWRRRLLVPRYNVSRLSCMDGSACTASMTVAT
jgi:hypothetical protein